MTMFARLVTEGRDSADRETFAAWRRTHELPTVPPDALPVCGVAVIGTGETVLAMGFLSRDTTTAVARICWPVANPDIGAEEATAALRYLIGGMLAITQDTDHNLVFASSCDGTTRTALEQSGFAAIDTGVTELALVLQADAPAVSSIREQGRYETEVLHDSLDLHVTAKGWWIGRECLIPPFNLLPTVGLLVRTAADKHPLAAGWIYRDNSAPIGTLAWTVTNPRNSPAENYEAMCVLIEGFMCMAKDGGCGVLLASAHHYSAARVFERYGFAMCETNVTHLAFDPAPTTLHENQPVAPRNPNR